MADKTRTIMLTAANCGTDPLLHRSRITTETTGVEGLATRTDADSSRDIKTNRNSHPPATMGPISGMAMRRNVVNQDAPQTYEASSISGLTWWNAAVAVRVPCGRWCAT